MSDLDWPAGWDRTPEADREPNRNFEVSLSKAFDDLETELDRLGVDEHRYSFDAQQRQRDQRPYARANPDHPGFVLRWRMDGQQYAVACDRYSRLRDNVQTVGHYIREKRKMDSRAVETGQSEFANARLPPGEETDDVVVAGDGGRQEPHEVLGVAEDAPDDVVKAVARRLSANVHPDKSEDGDREEYKRIQRAKRSLLGGDSA